MEDVTQPAEVTAIESSTEPTEAQSQSTDATQVTSDESAKEQAIPYGRFKEVNEELKGTRGTVQELQRKLQEIEGRLAPKEPVTPEVEQARQALAQLGYKPESELRAEMQKMMQQERENVRIEQSLTSLEKTYDGKDGRPKFDRQEVVNYALSKGFADPEAAYKVMNEQKLMDWHIKQALAKSGGTKSEASDGSGSSQAAGTSNGDLKEAAKQGDKKALQAYLKRLAFGQ